MFILSSRGGAALTIYMCVCSDKLLTAQVLSANNIPIPKTVLSMYPFDAKFIAKELGFPLIVKKVSGARGEAVWKVCVLCCVVCMCCVVFLLVSVCMIFLIDPFFYYYFQINEYYCLIYNWLMARFSVALARRNLLAVLQKNELSNRKNY